MTPFRSIVFWLAVATITTTTHRTCQVDAKSSAQRSSSSSSSSNNNKDDIDHSQCGVYLAISSTSTDAEPKWGVFAGRDMQAGVPIGYGDIPIHTMDLVGNNLWVDPTTTKVIDDLDVNFLANTVDWLEQFLWVPHSSGGQFEDADVDARIVTAIAGTGLLGAYNPRMTNADWNHSSAYHREAWNEYPGASHPGRGAYSNYYNLELATTEVIPAGKEIFVEYGENWHDENGEGKKKELLNKNDYDKVDKTIVKLIAFFDKYESSLDTESKDEIYKFLINDVMTAAAGTEKGVQIANMLPSDPSELKTVLESGGSVHLSSPNVVRSIEWLETNGRCMDNIRPGPSTIPYAGRGAFAVRDIKEGGLVAPVPLIHLPHELIFDMHSITIAPNSDADDDDDVRVREDHEVTGKQLLYNYVWGHRDSDLVFFPTGSVVNSINHSKEKVNARMVWSDHPNNQKGWFNVTPGDLVKHGYLGLIMEIVATKEIKKGDEIFLDYGDDWQAAWDKHVNEWEIREFGETGTWPMRALDLNQQHKSRPFRITGEEPSYPDNVMFKCFLMVKSPPEGEPEKDEDGNKIRLWSEADSGKTNLVSDNLFDCEPIKRHDDRIGGQYHYDVTWKSGREITRVVRVPHKAIVILDKPGTGDQHDSNAFRHWIGIPDDVFPEGPWRE
jgi:hypothetical protein